MEPLGSAELLNVIEQTDNVLAMSRDSDNGLVLTWPAEGWVLQQSASVTGGWADVPEATSPFPVVPGPGPGHFYRLRQAP